MKRKREEVDDGLRDITITKEALEKLEKVKRELEDFYKEEINYSETIIYLYDLLKVKENNLT
jgi:predicted CopG family antitoxin